MGTTFTNIQIKTAGNELPEWDLPKGYRRIKNSEEWYGIYEENQEYNMKRIQKLARDLSKVTAFPIIAVTFFDDDEFEMRLMKDGKTAASYYAGERGIYAKKVPVFIETLGLEKKDASSFRYLCKREMGAQESIALFSQLLGANLYSDLKMLEMGGELWKKDAASVEQLMKEEKALNKIDNQTVLNMLDEVPGLWAGDSRQRLMGWRDRRDGIVRIVKPDGKGSYDYSYVHCFAVRGRGLKEIYGYHYPSEIFGSTDKDLGLDYEHQWLSVMDCDALFCDKDWGKYEPVLSKLMEIPEDRKPKKPEGLIFRNWWKTVPDDRYEFLFHMERLEKIDWFLSGQTFSERKITAFYSYEELDWDRGYFWSAHTPEPMIGSGGQVICVRTRCKTRSDSVVYDVRFFDKDMSLIRTEEIPSEKDYLGFAQSGAYIEEKDWICFGSVALDLRNRTVKLSKRKIKGNPLTIRNGRGNMYLFSGTFVYIVDSDMELISRHSYKGRGLIYYYMNESGNFCFITCDDQTSSWNRPKGDCAVRFYEIADKQEILDK